MSTSDGRLASPLRDSEAAWAVAKCYTFSMSERRSRTLLWILIGGGAFFSSCWPSSRWSI